MKSSYEKFLKKFLKKYGGFVGLEIENSLHSVRSNDEKA